MNDKNYIQNELKEKSTKKNSTVFGRKGQHKKRKDIMKKIKNIDIDDDRYDEKNLKYVCHMNTKELKRISKKSNRKSFKQRLVKNLREGKLDDIEVDPLPFGNIGNSSHWD